MLPNKHLTTNGNECMPPIAPKTYTKKNEEQYRKQWEETVIEIKELIKSIKESRDKRRKQKAKKKEKNISKATQDDLRVHPYVPEEEQHDIILKPPPLDSTNEEETQGEGYWTFQLHLQLRRRLLFSQW